MPEICAHKKLFVPAVCSTNLGKRHLRWGWFVAETYPPASLQPPPQCFSTGAPGSFAPHSTPDSFLVRRPRWSSWLLSPRCERHQHESHPGKYRCSHRSSPCCYNGSENSLQQCAGTRVSQWKLCIAKYLTALVVKPVALLNDEPTISGTSRPLPSRLTTAPATISASFAKRWSAPALSPLFPAGAVWRSESPRLGAATIASRMSRPREWLLIWLGELAVAIGIAGWTTLSKARRSGTSLLTRPRAPIHL